MFIINFVKSLFIPSRMAKYATMNILIAIAIFFVASYILAFPSSTIASRKRYELVDVQNAYYLQIFEELSEDDLATLRNTSVRITNGVAIYNENVREGEPYIFSITKDGKVSHLYVVFDFFDMSDANAKPNYDINERFLKMEKVENDDYYLLVFYRDCLYYRNPKQANELQYLNNVSFDLATITDGSTLSYRLIDLFIPKIKSDYTFRTFISTVVYTFVIILLLWLFFHFSGTTYSFKAFYNIGAIASLVPLTILFILSWIIPQIDFMFYFSFLFGIYYLIMIIIINNKTKIA